MYYRHHLASYLNASPHRVDLQLADASGLYLPGADIRGTVDLDVGAAAAAPHACVELQWVARGSITTVQTLARHALPEGPWRPGERYSFPFSLTAPAIETLRGQRFASALRVAVVIESPTVPVSVRVAGRELSHDITPRRGCAMVFPASERAVQIQRAPAPLEVTLSTEDALRAASGKGSRGSVVVGIALCCTGVGAMALTPSLGTRIIALGIVAAIVGGLLLLAGLALLVYGLRNARGEHALGAVRSKLEQRGGVPGAPLDASLTTSNPAGSLRARCELRAWEHDATPTADTRLHSSRVELARHVTDLVARGPNVFSAELPVAALDDFPLPHRSAMHGVTWRAAFVITRGERVIWQRAYDVMARRGPRVPRIIDEASCLA